MLEALSRALPDDAYVTELRIDSMKLRVIGLAANAPALIAPLERSGHFAGAGLLTSHNQRLTIRKQAEISRIAEDAAD